MGLLIRLIIFPIMLVRRILWPMFKGFLKTPLKVGKVFVKSSFFIYLLSFVIIYLAVLHWTGGGKNSQQPPVILSDDKTPFARQKITQLPPIKGNVNDGNSAFAKSLWEMMDKPSRKLYSREFSYAMHYTQPGGAHLFTTPQDLFFGQIEPAAPYKSKSGTDCRNFEEVISYRGEAQRYRGKACRRAGKKGWCRLGPESTPDCEIGYSEGSWGSVKRKFRRWF